MTSAQTERRFTDQREIPVRRVMITDPAQIPRDIAATPNGTIYCTTPGGTRIVYDRSLLLKLSVSPMTKSPPKNMKYIPGVTSDRVPADLSKKTEPPRVKTIDEEQQFEMDI